MRLRVLAALLLMPAVVGAQRKSIPPRKASAMDYIFSHLKRMEGKRLSSDFFGAVFPLPSAGYEGYVSLSMAELGREGDCVLNARFSAIIAAKNAAVMMSLQAPIDLRQAEVGGVRTTGSQVFIRFLSPLKSTKQTTAFVLNPELQKAVGESKYEFSDPLEWDKFPLPCSDEEDAVRIGRAFEQQIRDCGGKTDPFAK